MNGVVAISAMMVAAVNVYHSSPSFSLAGTSITLRKKYTKIDQVFMKEDFNLKKNTRVYN